ncbi:MAG: Txe/YoeB family addiction module toxin [Rhizobiales bacterium]|nr:Txe/YoeB family addiction module toxin [Hyphomicrobiales bacterium]
MNLFWTADAWQDYLSWQDDPKTLAAINALIKDIAREPFKGIGKPEPLKHALQGWWSRRITSEHRLVYRVSGKGSTQQIEIIQCRYHY